MTYRRFVRWIADNDETAETNVSVIRELISVQMVADIYGREPLKVAADVLKHRAPPEKVSPWAGRGRVAPRDYDPKDAPTDADIRRRMFTLCGCIDKPHRGACDCRSVFNQAAAQLWAEHNRVEIARR